MGIADTYTKVDPSPTVTFDSAGGSAVAAQTLTGGSKATKPADPSKANYVFAGWTLDGETYDFNKPVTYDITLKATWRGAKRTVSFDSAEGSSVPSQIVVGGTTVSKPISPTRDGYAFAGWLRGGEPYDFSSPVASDMNLIASWEKADVSYTADSDWAAGAVGAVDGGTDLAFQNEPLAQDGASDVARQAWGQMSSRGAATIICVDVKLFVVGVDGRRLSELTDGLSIKVTLAVDPQYNGRKVKVTQVHEGQAIDHPEADRVRDGAVRPNVTQLSEFVIAVDDGPQEMHRLYNQWSGEHFYTADDEEFAGLVEFGWTDEGTGWTAPATSDTPVFRLYNPYAGEHHYTMNAAERDTMVATGWQYEDIGWYSDDAKTVPLFREYNPYMFANNHNYTTNREEHDGLVALGWVDEGEAWYGV